MIKKILNTQTEPINHIKKLTINLKKQAEVFFIAFTFIFYFPLFQISQFLPFAYWDAFTDQYAQLKGFSTEWSSLPGNIFYSFFLDKVQFRPISVTLFNLQYLIFKGEFWAWYLLKWIIFFACAAILYLLIKKSTQNQVASTLGLSFFLFHPMPFVTDVMAQDGYVVFFGALTLFFLMKWNEERNNPEIFSLEHLTRPQLSILFVLYAATAFSKEIGIAIVSSLLMTFIFTFRKKWTAPFYYRLCIPFIICIFMSYRLLQVNHPSSHLHTIMLAIKTFFQPSNSEHISKIITTTSIFRPELGSLKLFFRYFFPNSPHNALEISLLILIFFGFFLAIIKREKKFYTSFLFCLIGFFFSLIILSVVYPCPKYLPIPVFLFSFALGISSFLFLKYLGKVAIILVCLIITLIPILTAGNIYAQWLGMMQSLYEETDIIQFMEEKKREGYTLTWTGFRNKDELPWEKGASIQEFFVKSSTKFYGYKHSMEFKVLSTDGIPKNRFVMLTSLSPKQIASGALNSVGIGSLQGVVGIFQFQRERYGFFETVTGNLHRLEKIIGNQYPEPIDCASPHPSRFAPGVFNPDMYATSYFSVTSGPHLLYLFDRSKYLNINTAPTIIEIPPLRRYGAFGR